VRRPSILLRLLALALLPLAAACTENIESGAACPQLCPTENVPVRDTTLDAVVFDSTLVGLPLPGEPAYVLLASRPRPDTLEARPIFRFDSLPSSYFPVGGTDSVKIAAVDSSFLVVHIDTLSKRLSGSATITAYDVDTVAAVDSSAAALNTLFRPDRQIASYTFVADSLKTDSLRIPLSDSALAAKTSGSARLRIGLRITSGTGTRLRIVSSQGGTSSLAAHLAFDPTADTTYAPIVVNQASATPGERNITAGLRDFTIVAAGALPSFGPDLVVGGLPSRRTFLRFSVPTRLVDSSTIVRAVLQLTQRPVASAESADTVTIDADVVVADQSISDLLRSSELSAAGATFGVDSVRLSPADSGARTISLVNVVRAWHTLNASTQRAIVLRSRLEGSQAGGVRFYSIEAPLLAQRPRLRVSYIPRTEFALP